jgi:hypothetical protein
MKVILFAVTLCTIGSRATLAQTVTTITTPHYAHAKLRHLIKNAKTPEDYRVLRDYFSHVAEIDRAKAAEEKQEWDRRKTYPVRKYPSPVDSAHYLYDSYVVEADAAKAKSEHYEQLAENSTTHN